MNDEEVLARWLPEHSKCVRALTGDYCDAHDSSWDEAPMCDYEYGLAQGIRIGIDLARTGITDAIKREYRPDDRWTDGLRIAAHIARGWGR